MDLILDDPMGRMMKLEIADVRETGLTLQAELEPVFCNQYSYAHGGYVYAAGHMAAAQSAKLCLHRPAVVVDASTQYVRPLKHSPIRAEAELVRNGRELMVYRVRLLDGKGTVCCVQTVLLKEVDYPTPEPREFPRTIYPAGPEVPLDPVTGRAYPRLSPLFQGELCHIYVLQRETDGMVYGADLYPETCNGYGAAHGGLIYTCCDCAAGGSAVFLEKRKPVTVSSSIRYLRSITEGPIRARARLIHAGRQLMHYEVDVTDGAGVLSAVAQFALQSGDFPVRQSGGKTYEDNPVMR